MTEEPEDIEEEAPRPCRRCAGTGVDPGYHKRFTSGGHDERPCQECGGTGERHPEHDTDDPNA